MLKSIKFNQGVQLMVRTPECNGNQRLSLKSMLSSSNEVKLRRRLSSLEYESDALRVIFESAKSVPNDRNCETEMEM